MSRSLLIIKNALIENRNILKEDNESFDNGKILHLSRVDVSTFDAIKSDLTRLLQNPELQRHIAFHFQQLKALEKLYSYYADLASGMAATISGSEVRKSAIKQQLIHRISFLMSVGDEIIEMIDKELEHLQHR